MIFFGGEVVCGSAKDIIGDVNMNKRAKINISNLLRLTGLSSRHLRA